jgi:methyl-accepting chemotaxis protein
LIGAVLLGAALILILFFGRSISKPIIRVVEGLSESADQVTASSGQVSSSSQQLAEGASQQAASIEETSSSLEEMASMTKRNAQNAAEANRLMTESKSVVEQANHSMISLTTLMYEISRASEDTQKIVKTIDEIAFQTNLLALNAAVEAAGAGEVGAGFAVVADEVRNLAMRAAEAAKNTANLIEGIIKKIKDGSVLVERTSADFSRVEDSTAKMRGLIGEIAAASSEQAQGIEQVNRAISEMDRVVQQNASTTEESASASEEMSALAQQMKTFVYDLLTLVSGSGSGSQRSNAASEGRHHQSTTMIRTARKGMVP